MSSPAEYNNSLPLISKAYGILCFFTTILCQLEILSPHYIALYYPFVFRDFQLEKGVFEQRSADFLWMMIFGAISLLVLSAIPQLHFSFLGIPMVNMLLYVWSREYPNSQINMYGLVQLKSFYLTWAMLALDTMFGSPLLPGLMGIMVGHLYYFLTVLHPLTGGKNFLKTPMWVNRLVVKFRLGIQANTQVRPANTGFGAFRGRSYRPNQ